MTMTPETPETSVASTTITLSSRATDNGPQLIARIDVIWTESCRNSTYTNDADAYYQIGPSRWVTRSGWPMAKEWRLLAELLANQAAEARDGS